jgi:hypothetical protein
MRVLGLARGAELFEEDLTFLEAGLLAEPEAVGLAGQVAALLEEGQALEQRRKALRRAQLQRKAQAVAVDGRLDEQLRALHADALHAVKQDRKDRAFSSLFAENVQMTTRYALRRQVEVARGLVARLGLGLLPEELRARHTSALGALIEEGARVLEAQDQAEMEMARLRLELEDWKRDANAARMQVYGALLEVASGKGLRREWAERFFAQPEERGGASDAERDPSDGPS